MRCVALLVAKVILSGYGMQSIMRHIKFWYINFGDQKIFVFRKLKEKLSAFELLQLMTRKKFVPSVGMSSSFIVKLNNLQALINVSVENSVFKVITLPALEVCG